VTEAGLSSTDWPFQTSPDYAIVLTKSIPVAMQGFFYVEVGLVDPFDEGDRLDNVREGTIFQIIERLIHMDWAPHVLLDNMGLQGKPLYDAKLIQDFGQAAKDIPQPGLLEARLAL
jgi:hypothetical protein